MGANEHKTDAGDVTSKIGGHGTAGQLAPGKTPKVKPIGPQQDAPTGDDYIDKGAAGAGDLYSFLNDGQRNRLINAFQQRAIAAESHYQDAASQTRVDKLLAKEDTDLGWVASLLIDVALGFVAGQIISSLTKLHGSHKTAVKSAANVLAELWEEEEATAKVPVTQRLKSKASDAFFHLKPEQVRQQVNAAVGAGKKHGVAMINKGRKVAGEGTKASDLAYLDQLKDAAAIAFQQFRESVPATASDAELVVLYDAMDASKHLISQYKAEIVAKIARFEDAKVDKIGRNNETSWLRDEESGKVIGGGDRPVERAVWVQWQVYESGHPRELVYQYQEAYPWIGMGQNAPERNNTMEKLPGGAFDKPRMGVSNDPKEISIVPEEFVEVAIARHQQAFMQPVQVVLVDDSTYMWDPFRAKAARDNKERNAQGASKPKLQLGATPAPSGKAQP